jgi:hypothetical protein
MKRKKVNAWAVISNQNALQMWGSRNILVYDTLVAARKTKINTYGKGGTNARVVSCTIVYDL